MLHARPGSRAAGRGFARACGSSPRARCALFLYRICKKKWSHKGLAVRAHVFSSPILPHPISRGACGISANINLFSVALAAFLQRATVFPWHLQHSCKDQPYFRGACSVPAKTNRISVALAAFLQRPTVSPWHLQHSCKCQPYLRGLCSVPANANRISAAFAAFLQAVPQE